MKAKSHVSISMNAKKGIWQDSTPSYDLKKKLSIKWVRRDVPQHNKAIYDKSTNNIILNGKKKRKEKNQVIPLKTEKKMPTLTTPIHHIIGSLGQSN